MIGILQTLKDHSLSTLNMNSYYTLSAQKRFFQSFERYSYTCRKVVTLTHCVIEMQLKGN